MSIRCAQQTHFIARASIYILVTSKDWAREHKGLFPLRLRVALRCDRWLSLATQRYATQHAAVIETSLVKNLNLKSQKTYLELDCELLLLLNRSENNDVVATEPVDRGTSELLFLPVRRLLYLHSCRSLLFVCRRLCSTEHHVIWQRRLRALFQRLPRLHDSSRHYSHRRPLIWHQGRA